MAESKDPENMKLFGQVMNELMDRAIKNDSSFAEKEIDKLEAMMWQQYLSRNEAENIVNNMTPSAPWSFDTWNYALWVEMNKLMSDHSETFRKYGIPQEVVLPMVRDLALDNLKDKDGIYDIRHYFDV